jgi:glutamate mutase epsilon subunit
MILKFGGVPSEVIQQYQRGQLADMAKGVDLGSVLPQLEGKQAAIEVTATDGQTRQWSGDAKQMVNRLNSHVEVLNLLKDCIG